MATTTVDRERVIEVGAPFRVAWGAIIAGAVAALGIWLLLYALGLALGLSTVDPSDPGSLRSSGLFTGVWGLLVPLVALFVGGYVASRAGGSLTRGDGVIYGVLVWATSAILGVWLVATFLASVMGSAASLGKTALQSGGAALGGIAAGAGQAGSSAVESGQVQPGQAQDMAARAGAELQQQRERAEQRLSEAAPAARTRALAAADTTGKVFWGVFGALLLGLISAAAGAMVGAVGARHRRERTAQPVVSATPMATPPLRPRTEP